MKGYRKRAKSRKPRFEDWLGKDRVEPEVVSEVPSVSFMPEKGQDGDNEYPENLLESVLDRDNMNRAYKRVKANKGSHGVDGMTVDELLQFLKTNGERIKQEISGGTYRPKPVRRVEIPKPDGGIRLLGIPTVLDRVIQQAIAQVLSPIFEKQFSEHSYGFRPNRNAKQAVERSRDYIRDGYNWTVDIDLAKYFDTVNHDKLIGLIRKTIKDKRVVSLIRKYLKSGVMINGVAVDTESGCPQGGPLSPLLSNIMLHELDKELEKRGHKFCRYADDCNIYVKSEKAANRVMKSVTKFIEGELKLKVNGVKSTVDRPWRLKFLGFSYYVREDGIGIRAHDKSLAKFKAKLKRITSRSNAMSIEVRIAKLNQVIIGWVNYFGLADITRPARELDKWLRRRLRMCIWKTWKKARTKLKNLIILGIAKGKAWEHANTRKSYWRTAGSPILSVSLNNEYLRKLGLRSISERYSLVH